MDGGQFKWNFFGIIDKALAFDLISRNVILDSVEILEFLR